MTNEDFDDGFLLALSLILREAVDDNVCEIVNTVAENYDTEALKKAFERADEFDKDSFGLDGFKFDFLGESEDD